MKFSLLTFFFAGKIALTIISKRINFFLLVCFVKAKEINFPFDQFQYEPTYLVTDLLNSKISSASESSTKNNSKLEVFNHNISSNFSTYDTISKNETADVMNNSNVKQFSFAILKFYFFLNFTIICELIFVF